MSKSTARLHGHGYAELCRKGLLLRKGTAADADLGCRGLDKCEEVQAKHSDVNWHVTMMSSQSVALARQ